MPTHLLRRRSVKKKWIKNFVAICVLFGLAVFALGGRRAVATSKKSYKCDLVDVDTMQSMVDQRAADGWRLAAVSAYSHPAGSTSVERVVLVFEKE